jgi:rubrerythrin
MKNVLVYNNEKYEHLGNGCKATGASNVWRMSSEIYFRCVDCGYLMNGNPKMSDNCPCNSLYKDSDYGRFGSKHGDDSIEVYRKL